MAQELETGTGTIGAVLRSRNRNHASLWKTKLHRNAEETFRGKFQRIFRKLCFNSRLFQETSFSRKSQTPALSTLPLYNVNFPGKETAAISRKAVLQRLTNCVAACGKLRCNLWTSNDYKTGEETPKGQMFPFSRPQGGGWGGFFLVGCVDPSATFDSYQWWGTQSVTPTLPSPPRQV